MECQKEKAKPLDIMSRSGGAKKKETFGHNVQKWRAKRKAKPLDIMSRSGGDKRETKLLDIMSRSGVLKEK